jgi:hypothetical protein
VSRFSARRIGLTVLGGLAAVSLVAVLITEIDAAGFGRAGDTGGLAWLAPVVVGASIGVVAWLALRALPRESAASPRAEHGCPACGRLILDDWRLCPHCGTLVECKAEQVAEHTTS